MSTPDVADWTDAIVRQIPRGSVIRAFLMPRLLHPSEGASGRCPKCGRALPVFSFPPAGRAAGFEPVGRATYTDHERTLECLVDGFNEKYGRDVALPVLLDAVAQIGDAMRRQGWQDDAWQLHDLTLTSHEDRRAEQVGQELLRQRYRLIRKAGLPALALAASLARYWPISTSTR